MTCVGNGNGIIMNGPATADPGDFAAGDSTTPTQCESDRKNVPSHQFQRTRRDCMIQQKEAGPRPNEKPCLLRHDNLKEITFECPAWQCSVTVPPAPSS